MEIKYTLEILTKDIQDIGKLVENLHNSPEGSTLELDLALSKLRNVYDVLSEIKDDMSSKRHPFQQAESPSEAPAPAPPVQPEAEPETVAVIPEPEPGFVAPPTEPEPVVPPPEQEPVPATSEPESIAEPEPIAEPESLAATPEPEQEAPAPPPEPEPDPEVVVESPSGSGTIAEKFTAESSINENMAGNRVQDKDSKLMGPPIDNIGRNIGINDRFLIIRELFDGDSDGFGQLIKDLDNAGGLQDASERLSARFSENPDHEGVLILSSLLKRRFSQT